MLLHYQTVSEPAVIKRLISVLNKSTGEVTKKKPKLLTKGQNALVELQTQRPVALELYKDSKSWEVHAALQWFYDCGRRGHGDKRMMSQNFYHVSKCNEIAKLCFKEFSCSVKGTMCNWYFFKMRTLKRYNQRQRSINHRSCKNFQVAK